MLYGDLLRPAAPQSNTERIGSSLQEAGRITNGVQPAAEPAEHAGQGRAQGYPQQPMICIHACMHTIPGSRSSTKVLCTW